MTTKSKDALVNLAKVGESLTVYRYDNGWLIQIDGRDRRGEYVTVKLLCNTEEELLGLIRQANSMELDK